MQRSAQQVRHGRCGRGAKIVVVAAMQRYGQHVRHGRLDCARPARSRDVAPARGSRDRPVHDPALARGRTPALGAPRCVCRRACRAVDERSVHGGRTGRRCGRGVEPPRGRARDESAARRATAARGHGPDHGASPASGHRHPPRQDPPRPRCRDPRRHRDHHRPADPSGSRAGNHAEGAHPPLPRGLGPPRLRTRQGPTATGPTTTSPSSCSATATTPPATPSSRTSRAADAPTTSRTPTATSSNADARL
jgi:hypothetical protein